MSKPSDRVVGNIKQVVGEVLGDGKLVEEGERLKRDDHSEQAEQDDIKRHGPAGTI